MPKQYVCCGRPVPRLGTRRISFLLVSLALFAVFSLLFTLPGAVPTGPSLKAAGRSFSIPKSLKSPWMSRIHLYPFKQPAHPPARQRNDTDGDSWWYADWKWLLMPFSSSVTLDENRALLPMLKERTPIYCYYDNTAEKDRPSRDAESDLLLAWRRAWWAQGFRPIILSPAEAMNNPLYEELQRLQDVTPELRVDLMRWLAWENMGDGLLAHRLLFPMGLHGDPLLTFLRRGEFPELTRFKGLDGGLFVGPKSEVTAAVKIAMAGPQVKEVKDLVAAVQADKRKQKDPFAVDDTPKSLAYYSERQIVARYAKVAEAIRSSRASGIKSLTQLINAHLHLTWQSIFSDGIAVVKPLRHTTTLIAPGYELASRLAHCSESPLPDTCPPNRPRCTPCDDSKPMKITTPQHYSNASTLYTIGAVPHPYTSSTLDARKSHVDIGWIRRASPRDAWITALTEALFSPSVSTGPRLLRFKQAVASDDDDQGGGGGGVARSLWLPAEQAAAALPDDLDWHFGFALPDRATYASSSSSATAAATNDDADTADHSPTKKEEGEKEEEALEAELFTRAQTIVLGASAKTTTSSFPHHNKNTKTTKPKPKSKPTARDLALRDALEAWNLADTEAWRFARAHLARGSVERRRWEEDEARYAGGMGSEKKKKSRKNNNKNQSGGAKRAWDRWLDRD